MSAAAIWRDGLPRVFAAVGYWPLMGVLQAVARYARAANRPKSVYPNANLEGANITPEYLGVGYIVGPALPEMTSGGVLSWLGADSTDFDVRSRRAAHHRLARARL